MKIALLGYGKMGKEIEKIALERNHIISFRINSVNTHLQQNITSHNTDVIIEFTTPSAAYDNILIGLKKKIPVVSGSTGWHNKDNVLTYCKNHNGTLLLASNFSLGMNIFFLANKYLAKLVNKENTYKVSIAEEHHIEKKDTPSGTSLILKEDLENILQNKTIPISAKRTEGIFGNHSVSYSSIYDGITIEHSAKSRKGFSLGAILAAEYIKDKKGIFKMEDILLQS